MKASTKMITIFLKVMHMQTWFSFHNATIGDGPKGTKPHVNII